MSNYKPERERKLPHLTQASLDKLVDEHGRVHWSMTDGRRVCGRLKKKHNRKIEDECCLGIPMANGACKVHGGKAGPPLKHGRYSRALKTWQDAFERARCDTELVDTRRDIALMDTAIEQLLARVEELDSPSWRAEVKSTFDGLQEAIRRKRNGPIASLLKELGELIDRGAGVDQTVADLLTQVDKRANRANKAAELALRREEKVTVSELAALFKSWIDIIRSELGEAEYLRVLPSLRRATTARGIEAPEGDGNGGGLDVSA